MREICLDTETTGLDPRDGHRIIEIGAIELVNKVKTGRHFHAYINPEREVPEEAFKIHGISTEFLSDKPKFTKIVTEFMDFVKDAKLVIHNAAFDMKFINFELRQCELEIIERGTVIDSLQMARDKFPGAANSLDALCKRFGVDNSKRIKHGALLDAELLADIYLELSGGGQYSMFEEAKTLKSDSDIVLANENLAIIPARNFELSVEDEAKHQEFIKKNFKENFWGY